MSQEEKPEAPYDFRKHRDFSELSSALIPAMVLPNHWRDDVSNELYHRLKSSVSSTPIKHMLNSPNDFAWNFWFAPSKEQTPAMRFGTLIHTILLEPHLFEKTHQVLPEFEGGSRTKKYQEAKEAYISERPGITFIDKDDLESLLWIRENAYRNLDARAMLEGGIKERSGFYTDPETGIQCRIRPDILMGSFLADVKSSFDPHKEEFMRQAWNLRYDISMAMYAEGIKEIDGQIPEECFWIVAGTKPPHDVVVYRLTPSVLKIGSSDYRWALKRLRKSIESQNWAGVQEDEVVDIDLPPWAKARS